MLLYRAGVISTNSDILDDLFYIGDFGADVSVVVHSTLELVHKHSERKSLLHDRDALSSKIHLSQKENSIEIWDIDKRLKSLDEEYNQICIRLLIWSIQTISSGNYPPINLWRRIFGKDCPDTLVGLSGVLSSSLIICNIVISIANDIARKKNE